MFSGKHFHLTILILHQADMDILKESKKTRLMTRCYLGSQASVGLFLQSQDISFKEDHFEIPKYASMFLDELLDESAIIQNKV